MRPRYNRACWWRTHPKSRCLRYLPEESYLYQFLNARETLEYYAKLFEIDRATRERRIDELLDMVGLTGAQFRPVREYSKGMQRRIGLAQALINDPEFLILDEPTTGLDPIGTRQVKDLIIELGRRGTVERMASHVSHVGVHDHGFNNVSTYGNLLRLMHEGRYGWNDREREFYELGLKVSGAVQAARWTRIADGTGYIHSFNGAHSLFVDTIRSCRALAVAHQLGHVLMGEQDAKISLLQRVVEHAFNTARYNIYFGEGRDAYDIRGRTAHEAVFNTASGVFRCPNSQQGYSPFSTWTRGLAWAILGFAEQAEFFGFLMKSVPLNELNIEAGATSAIGTVLSNERVTKKKVKKAVEVSVPFIYPVTLKLLATAWDAVLVTDTTLAAVLQPKWV